MSDTGPNEVKRRTMQIEAFGASSATIGRYITAEVLTNLLLGVPWSPWLPDFEVERESRKRSIGDLVLGCPRWTADDS